MNDTNSHKYIAAFDRVRRNIGEGAGSNAKALRTMPLLALAGRCVCGMYPAAGAGDATEEMLEAAAPTDYDTMYLISSSAIDDGLGDRPTTEVMDAPEAGYRGVAALAEYLAEILEGGEASEDYLTFGSGSLVAHAKLNDWRSRAAAVGALAFFAHYSTRGEHFFDHTRGEVRDLAALPNLSPKFRECVLALTKSRPKPRTIEQEARLAEQLDALINLPTGKPKLSRKAEKPVRRERGVKPTNASKPDSEDSLYTAKDAARKLGLPYDKVRRRMERWRNANPTSKDYMENPKAPGRTARFAYKLSRVREVCADLFRR